MMKITEAQIKFLSEYLPKMKPKKETTRTLVAKIRKRFLFTDGARMTNVEGKIFKHASLYIRYDYLRQLTYFVPEKSSLASQFSSKKSSSALYHFTSSGQAAILGALGFLKSLECVTFESPSALYWETEQTLDLLGFTKSQDPSVYWIDSSSFDVFKDWTVPESVKWVVVDSTCWHVLGEEFEVLQERLKDYEVITVRSHVKLDMLGIEYASLGSIILAGKNLDINSGPFYQAARLFAITASPEAIAPYLLEPKCLELGLRRMRTMKKAHVMIQELVSEQKLFSKAYLQFPPHGLYFYIALKDSRLDVSQIQERMKGLGKDSGVEVRQVESFGFDFFGLQVFKPKREPDFNVCLRLSYGAEAVTKVQLRRLLLEMEELL